MGWNKRTSLLAAAIVTFGLGTLYLGLTMEKPHKSSQTNSWDILIFTQTWPYTLCYSWKLENASHTCNMPPVKDLWSIHGIWPTKYGTIGPSFCNKSLIFDPTFIYGIKDKLNEYWTDILIKPDNTTEAILPNVTHKKESIWFHEWTKHGTCAITLPALNSEFKYFNQGVEWSEKYNMKYILEKSGIKVNSTSNVNDYWKAVKSVLKTNVWIECFYKADTKEQLLDEIRICFDKTLKLIDCDGIMSKSHRKSAKSHPLTNCDLNKPILYLDYVPEYNSSTNSNSTNSNSTVNEHAKVLLRSKRKVVDPSNEWVTKTPRHFNRSHSYQPRTNNSFVHNLNRSNSYPYIQRY